MKRCVFFICLMIALSLLCFACAELAPLPIDETGGRPWLESGRISQTEYRDESIHVTIEKGRAFDTDYYIARITIADPSQLRTVSAGGFDSDMVAPGETIAKRVNAVLAINGDYFNFMQTGYVVRQGTVYRNLPTRSRDTLIVTADGNFHLVPKGGAENLAPYMDLPIVNSFNFGPILMRNGVRTRAFKDKGDAPLKRRQRMAIAQTGELSYACVCCESSVDVHSKGMELNDFAVLMKMLGLENAYNLDGGDSTMMIFLGERVNVPESPNIRDVSDMIYFASLGGEEKGQ